MLGVYIADQITGRSRTKDWAARLLPAVLSRMSYQELPTVIKVLRLPET